MSEYEEKKDSVSSRIFGRRREEKPEDKTEKLLGEKHEEEEEESMVMVQPESKVMEEPTISKIPFSANSIASKKSVLDNNPLAKKRHQAVMMQKRGEASKYLISK